MSNHQYRWILHDNGIGLEKKIEKKLCGAGFLYVADLVNITYAFSLAEV